jgi:MFS family permease
MEAVREALRYVGGQTHQIALLIYVGVAALFALPYLLLMPVFAKDVFRGDAQTSAQLMSSIGIGAMIGGVVMARRRKIRGLGRHVALATLGFAAAAASFAVVEDLGAARLALVAAGCCMVMAMIGAQTLVQTLVADEFRGRVMSFYTMMSLGLMPFGNLLTGLEAKLAGPRWAMGICSAVSALAGLALLAGMPVIRKSARATREYARIMEMP